MLAQMEILMTELIFRSSHINEAVMQVRSQISKDDPFGHEWLYDNYPKPDGQRRRSSTGFVRIGNVNYPVKPLARLANELAGQPMRRNPITNAFRSYFRRFGFEIVGENIKESEKHTKRQKHLAEVLSRNGQAKFRSDLMAIFGNMCIVSNCNIPEALQAAHIVTKKGHDLNKISNGLILRSDIHLLFDADLMSIDPRDFVVSFDERCTKYYSDFHGKSIYENLQNHPNLKALSEKLKKRS